MNLCHRLPRIPAQETSRRAARVLLPLAVVAVVAVAAGAIAVSAAGDAVPEAPPLPGRLVYSRAKSFQWNLFTSDADGRNEGQLTAAKSQNSKGDDEPRWSWDGRQIAFANFSKDGDKAFIWRVPFAGGTPTPVATANAEDAGDPAWGPGENTIIFAGARTGAGPSTLDLIVWTPAGARTLLDSADIDERDPDWSRDGREIAYAALRADGGSPASSIRVVDADGSNDRSVFALAGQTACYPRWSPDGSRLAIVSFPGDVCFGRGALWLLEPESNRLTQIVRQGISFPAVWSPDGEYLLVYNTLQSGLEFPDQSTPTAPPPNQQLLGLYLLRLSDNALFRLKDAAGGATARVGGYEWGQHADWTGGTHTPTPEVTLTPTSTTPPPTDSPTPTPSSTATSAWSPTPTASRTATPTETERPELTPTLSPTPEPLPPIYLPAAYRNSNGNGSRR